MRTAIVLAVTALASTASFGRDWSIGVASGPFISGHFAERTSRITNGSSTVAVTSSLSAETSAGLIVDLERHLNDRFSIRLDATFTRAPLAIKTDSEGDDPSSDSLALEIGEMDTTAVALAAAFRFNRGGSVRPYLYAGPAYVIYDVDRNEKSGAIPIFEGSRGRAAAVAGAGLEWWWRPRFGVRGEVSDTYSESPLKREDVGGVRSVEIKRVHNIHSSVGVKVRF